jgi:hypothetical protein
MRTELDYIIINGEQIPRPPKFSPAREDIYKGDYVTCTGKTIADKVGWKYSDMSLEWDALPQQMVDVLINMSGVNTVVFDDLDGELVSEQVVRTSAVALRHRYTQGGVTIWKKVKVEIKFIGSHTED